jgi:L-gulonolactone oxidase
MKPMHMETIRLADWSGFTDFGGTAEVYAPRNESEIVDLVHYCRDNQKKLRVVGLQTSWNTLWYCQDVMMTTKYLNNITEINVENRTITCETGATLEQIHKTLWEKGLTLNTAPGVDWVTIGGSISTGSHGSGPASNSSSMIGCRLVTADGQVVEIGEADELLDAVRVSMGALGVLSTVTLKVVDAFYVSLQRIRIPTQDWKRYLTEGEMSYLLWFPHTEYSVLAKVDVISDPAEAQKRAEAASSNGFDANNPEDLERLGVDVAKYSTAVMELANIMPSTFPARNRYLLDVFFQDIEKVGPAHEVLTSFRSVPIAGGEWSVPVSRFEAALADMQAEIGKGDFYLPIVWLKKVAGESAWLSAADEESVQCGIYHNLIKGTPSHVKEMVMRIERLMLRHGGRPHLGKLIYLDPADLKRSYPNWDKFNALRRQIDPDGMFWSEGLAASFGD